MGRRQGKEGQGYLLPTAYLILSQYELDNVSRFAADGGNAGV